MRMLVLLAFLGIGLGACNGGYGSSGELVIWAEDRNAGR